MRTCSQIALFDIPKLLFHSLNLKDFMAQGFPLPIIFFYATLLLANWLIALYRFQHRSIDRKCVVRRLSLLYVSTCFHRSSAHADV